MQTPISSHWPQITTVLAVVLIAAFSVAYITLGVTNYTRFQSSIDLAGYGQALHHLSHFELPYSTIKDQVLWGDHAHFILVLIAPIYRIIPDVRVLLVLQALAVTLAAWPLFHAARKLTQSSLFALALTYAYLSFVGIQYALNVDFHPSVLTGAFLMWALFALVERRWHLYWIAVALTLITREDAATIVCMIGVYLLIRREWKRGLATMVIAAAYFLTVVYAIMPIWTPGHIPLTYLDTDEKSVWSVVRGFFFYPKAIVQNMFDAPEKRATINALFASFGYLPLLSPLTYLGSAPIFYARFPSPNEYRWLLENHSNANSTPILVFGTLFAVAAMLKFTERRGWITLRRALPIACAVLLIVSTQRTAWSRETIPFRKFFTSDYRDDTQELTKIRPAFEEARSLIPPDAGVSASSGFLAHLSNRAYAVNYPTFTQQTKWILVSHRVNPWPLNHDSMREDIRWLERRKDFEKVFIRANVWLFKRRGTSSGASGHVPPSELPAEE